MVITVRTGAPLRARGTSAGRQPRSPDTAHAWLLPLLLGAVVGAIIGGVGVLLGTQFIPGGVRAPVPVAQVADPNPDLSLSLSDGLMTALVRQYITQGQSPVAMEGVQVMSRDGRIVVAGNVPLVVGRVPGSVELAPSVSDGRLRMRVLIAALGPVRVPADLSGLLEVPINQHLDQITSGFNATITGASAGGNGLTVTARVNQPLPR